MAFVNSFQTPGAPIGFVTAGPAASLPPYPRSFGGQMSHAPGGSAIPYPSSGGAVPYPTIGASYPTAAQAYPMGVQPYPKMAGQPYAGAPSVYPHKKKMVRMCVIPSFFQKCIA